MFDQTNPPYAQEMDMDAVATVGRQESRREFLTLAARAVATPLGGAVMAGPSVVQAAPAERPAAPGVAAGHAGTQ